MRLCKPFSCPFPYTFMYIPSEHSLCLPCFFSRERIPCRKAFKKLINTQKNPQSARRRWEQHSQAGEMQFLHFKIRAGNRSSCALSVFSIFHSLADSNRRVITCKEGELGLWVELEGQEMRKPQPFQEMAFRAAFPGARPANQKKWFCICTIKTKHSTEGLAVRQTIFSSPSFLENTENTLWQD